VHTGGESHEGILIGLPDIKGVIKGVAWGDKIIVNAQYSLVTK
jgi:hypothetical protein